MRVLPDSATVRSRLRPSVPTATSAATPRVTQATR